MAKQELEHGELTRIIIGTVVAAGDDGINARELTEKLNSWGIEVTVHHMGVRLAELYNDGRINRISRGRYEGV